MTYEEHAEKICQEFRRLQKENRGCACKFIAAQIREAVEEAEKRVYDDYAKEFIEKEEALLKRVAPGRRKAKAEAYEEAAKIAESYVNTNNWDRRVDGGREIASKIRALKEMK